MTLSIPGTFYREVIIDHLTPEMVSLEQQGELIFEWKEDSIVIWVPQRKTSEQLAA
jgi:hypothetical protein